MQAPIRVRVEVRVPLQAVIEVSGGELRIRISGIDVARRLEEEEDDAWVVE